MEIEASWDENVQLKIWGGSNSLISPLGWPSDWVAERPNREKFVEMSDKKTVLKEALECKSTVVNKTFIKCEKCSDITNLKSSIAVISVFEPHEERYHCTCGGYPWLLAIFHWIQVWHFWLSCKLLICIILKQFFIVSGYHELRSKGNWWLGEQESDGVNSL